MTTFNYGPDAQDRLAAATDPGPDGARSALESFYYAFNSRNIDALGSVWCEEPMPQLNNPLGGMLRGKLAIVELYRRIFGSPARVWVRFGDALEYFGPGSAVFAGRENGEYRDGETAIPLIIRTTRIFHYLGSVGWRQVHHHGSIDDADALRRYQDAVKR
jgi:hypothetical protein